MALPAPTKLTRRYLLDFSWRAAVFAMILGIYLYDKTLLNFTGQTRLFWPLSMLWIAVLISMLAQLNPKSGLTTGCMKQFVSGYQPVANYDREKLKDTVRRQNIGALKVAAVWLAVNGFFGFLYIKKVFTVAELLLLGPRDLLSDLTRGLRFSREATGLL